MAIPTVDDVWADFNPDGSVHEPVKQDIRRLLRFIQAIGETNGMKTYPNATAMNADTTQPDGQAALRAAVQESGQLGASAPARGALKNA